MKVFLIVHLTENLDTTIYLLCNAGREKMFSKFNFEMIFFILTFCIFNFFLECEVVEATDINKIYVGGTGLGNYSFIQDAIDNSSKGDIIFVYSGNYSENLIISNSIILLGANKYNVSISGNEGLYSILIKSSGITISGFTIQNSNAGIIISGSEFKFCNISQNIIKNNLEGIRVINSSNNNITNNIIQQHSNLGLVFYNSKNNVILKNTFIDNKKGIFLGRWSNFNIISENNFSNYTKAIHLDFSFNNQITKNLIKNGDYGIYLAYSKNNNITNNFIEYNKQSGLYFSDSDENVISPNIFSNNYQDISKKTKPPSIKTPSFEILLVFFTILFIILFKKSQSLSK